MPDRYKITVTTKSGETYEGLMTRSQPEMVNGLYSIALADGSWVYLAPDDVLRMVYVPQPEEETNRTQNGDQS